MQWHPCCPSTLIWVAALDGGDPKSEPGPGGFRDMLYTQTVNLGGGGSGGGGAAAADAAAAEGATECFGFETRWSGWWFTAAGVGLMRERRWKDRREVMWRRDADGTRVKLWQRMYQDRYADPGSPEEEYNDLRQLVLQSVPDAVVPSGGGGGGGGAPCVYFMGSGASPRGDRPFVDARTLEPGAHTARRVWRSPAGPSQLGDAAEIAEQEVDGALLPEAGRDAVYENPIYILGSRSQLLLLRRESSNTPPNYLLRHLETGETTRLTSFEHPQPQLAQTQSSIISYKRRDGIDLTAKLYLPAVCVCVCVAPPAPPPPSGPPGWERASPPPPSYRYRCLAHLLDGGDDDETARPSWLAGWLAAPRATTRSATVPARA
jgi:hypothetical protein